MEIPAIHLDACISSDDPWAAFARQREQGWIASSPAGLHVLAFDPAFEVLRDPRYHQSVVPLLDGAGIADEVVRARWLGALSGRRSKTTIACAGSWRRTLRNGRSLSSETS